MSDSLWHFKVRAEASCERSRSMAEERGRARRKSLACEWREGKAERGDGQKDNEKERRGKREGRGEESAGGKGDERGRRGAGQQIPAPLNLALDS